MKRKYKIVRILNSTNRHLQLLNLKTLILVLFLVLSACQADQTFKEINFKLDPYEMNNTINFYLQGSKDGGTWARRYAHVAEHEKAILAADITREAEEGLSADSLTSFHSQYTSRDAQAYILEKASDHKIILFSEAHYFPRHFNFFKSCLRDLHKLGYKYIALEALSKDAGVLNDPSDLAKIRMTTDPEYVKMMREGLSLGYTLFGYDQGSGTEREMEGAKNIQAFLKGKEGKALVLCGYDHIKEGPTGTYWDYALAGRLKEYMLIEPLTINQHMFIERSERPLESPLYQTNGPENSVVFLDDQGESYKDPDNPYWYDMILFHPRTTYENGKARWFVEGLEKVKIDLNDLELEGPLKVLAYFIDDNIDRSTPIDITEVKTHSEDAYLFLPKGEFKIIVTNGKKSFQKNERN